MPARESVLITGASSGIGRELALVFAEHGHDLVLVARSRDKLEELAKTISKHHGCRAQVVAMDLTGGEVVYINGRSYELLVQWARLQPRWLVRTITGFLSRRFSE